VLDVLGPAPGAGSILRRVASRTTGLRQRQSVEISLSVIFSFPWKESVMTKRLVWFAVAALVVLSACRSGDNLTPLGATYERIARPAIWRILPGSQAESLGLEPGDVILSYNDEPVATNDELWQLQSQTTETEGSIPMTVLRGEQEINVAVRPGPLGVIPDADRYSSSLAVALEDILSSYGSVVDYDWLVAAAGESFTFTASKDECPRDWPGALAGDYLDVVEDVFGLDFQPVFTNEGADTAQAAAETRAVAVPAIRDELARGRTILVLADWPDDRWGFWGIVTRYDTDDSLFYGCTIGSAVEVPLTGVIEEAYDVRYSHVGEIDPDRFLTAVLAQSLELGQAAPESGWQSGIAAYDVWIAKLDTVPFCRYCGSESQACFDQLVWSSISNKESVNRLLSEMREALPDLADLIDELKADNSAILGKLEGVVRSGTRVGTPESQRKLARTVNEIQMIEADLLQVYEDLIAEL
jgi:hypothetical protein